MESSLEIILNLAVILLAAGIIGALFSYFKLPAVLSFIFTGILIGPGGLALVSNTTMIRAIAELGIIFLLFILGAELSLPRLKEVRIHALWAGVLQLGVSILILSMACLLFHIPMKTAFFLAGALSLSSTAIVLKVLEDQGELETPHGRLCMGILIVQDLALVPLMAYLPFLTGVGGTEDLLLGFFWLVIKSGFFLGSILFLSWRFAPRLIDKVAATGSQEILGVFVVSFGLLIAIISQMMGLSYAVGAFIAGLSLSQSLACRQVIANTLPFRYLFTTVFFVSVGMLVHPHFVFEHLPVVLGTLLLLSVAKMAAIGIVILFLRFPLKTILWTMLSLFQVGEFSFVLLETGLKSGTISPLVLSTLNSTIVLSMLLTPIVMRQIPKLIAWLEAKPAFMKTMQRVHTPQVPKPAAENEVVIAGYGPIAKNLTQILMAHQIDYRIIEMNLQTVKRLQSQGISATFGDASNLEVLRHANLEHAKIFAVTIPDIRATELAIQNAKQINPNIYCIVRSRYHHPLETLFKLGADEVIYEEFETSMSFIYSILDLLGNAISDRESYMLLLRENRKALLHAGQAPEEDQSRYGRFSVFKDTKIEWIAIPEKSPLIGMTLADSEIRARTGVNVLSLIEPDGTDRPNPDPMVVLKAHQVLVVIGTIEQLTQLEVVLCG